MVRLDLPHGVLAHDDERAGPHVDVLARLDRSRVGEIPGGVDDHVPGRRCVGVGQVELHVLLAGVEENDEVLVDDRLTPAIALADAVAVEEHADAAAESRIPVLGLHLGAVGAQPDDVGKPLVLCPPDRPAVEEPAPAEGGVLGAQTHERRGELDQRMVGGVPVHPGQLVVLGVPVVVAQLRAAELVAVQKHGHALREHERRDEVPLLPGAHGEHLRVVGRPLDPEIVGAVVRLPVVVVLAVGVVVLVVIAHEITEREAVVGGDEVDGCDGSSPGVLVQIGGPGEARCELTQRLRLTAPEVAHRIPVLAVPLRPLRREVADLVAPGPDVPRLGDQLHLRNHRVLLHEFEERRQSVDVVELPRQRGGEVEAESVDVHLEHPVPQRVHDQLQGMGIADVQAVAGAGVVGVVALVVVLEPVVGRVVDSAHRERRAEVVALSRVVVDDVEDDLDARRVERTDHPLEFLHLVTVRTARGVGVVWCKEGDRVVAPVVREPLVLQGAVVDELVHRHEFDRRDPELVQMLDHRRMGNGTVGAPDLVRNAGVQLGQPLHVRLVDDRGRVRRLGVHIARPVEERVDDDAHHHVLRGILVVAGVGIAEVVAEDRLPPVDLTGNGLRVGVQQQLVRVEPLTVGWVVGAMDAVSVALPGPDLREVHMPDEGVDLRHLDARLFATLRKEAQLYALGRLTEQREIRAIPVVCRTEWVSRARPCLHCQRLPTDMDRRCGLHIAGGCPMSSSHG
ncbi:hypothetical protein MIC448_90005 [Microbacterium sp. C448]|nr:hypothetical protein MIC448_90005 [Microbacterium sp. C448]